MALAEDPPVWAYRDYLALKLREGELGAAVLGGLPVVVLIGSLVFYAALFKRWNSAPVFVERTVIADPESTFSSGVDLCRITPSKVHVEAWVALRGHQRRTHESSLLVRDAETGEHIRMKSRVVLRPEVSRVLEDRYEDGVNYEGVGLEGSLNLRKGGRAIAHGQIVAAYDTGNGFILVELPCEF